jgi:hypothetical protein
MGDFYMEARRRATLVNRKAGLFTRPLSTLYNEN